MQARKNKILQVLSGGQVMTPREIFSHMRGMNKVVEWLAELRDAGLVEDQRNGWRITDAGRTTLR